MPRNTGIAIVGMACRFPDAEDIPAAWRMWREGRHAFRTPPPDRWDHQAFFSTSQRTMDRYYVPTGAFLKDVRRFAAIEFGISPRRVEVMDPQQRLSLEAAANLLIDAGYGPGQRRFDRRRVGTWMGVTATEYRTLVSSRLVAGLMAHGELGEGTDEQGAALMAAAISRVMPSRPFSAAGVLANMVASVIAQELNLGGPAYTLDAACASAMVAVNDAICMLRDGQVDMAVAGGVYLNFTAENLIAFSRIGAISKQGFCRPFDARADGFVQGEGVGLVLLKRIEDAVRDNDRIYAVIAGSAVNNDGRGDGPMSPRMEGQVEVIQQAWRDADLNPERIGYIEAHGTGTAVGDRVELSALRAALGRPHKPIALGSVKANIGHTMSAAGIAGLIRATLALHHRRLPPLANWQTPHPDHDLEDGFFRVPTQAEAWTSLTPRVATVSSFGFGGTNGHLVLEEAGAFRPRRVLSRPGAPATPAPVRLVTLSADTGQLLAEYAKNVALSAPDAGGLEAITHTLNAQKPRRVRLGIVSDSVKNLIEKLEIAHETLCQNPAYQGNINSDIVIASVESPLPIAFLCPGQGMQQLGMLRDWLALPAFLEPLRDLEAELSDCLAKPLLDYLYAPEATEAELTDTAVAQPVMLALGVAVAAVLKHFGVEPSVVLGHSLGEFTATVLSEAVSAADAIRFVTLRGQAMNALPGDHGTMAAVMAPAEAIAPLVQGEVVLANFNHPTQTVISGPCQAVEHTVEILIAAGFKVRPLKVSHAFHAPLMAAIQPQVQQLLSAIPLSAPRLPLASCIAEKAPQTVEEIQAIFIQHATAPVQYMRGLKQCQAAGAKIYLQLTPGRSLSSFAKGSIEDASAILSVGEGFEGLMRVLATLYVYGHPVELSGLGEGLALLPPVPRSTEEYWVVTEESQKTTQFQGSPSRPAVVPEAPAPAVAPPPVIEDHSLEATVLRVIAKVSAFPLEAIHPKQRLLDDLGFDSLMLAELGNKLSDAFPGVGGLPRALLAQNPSVETLISFVKNPATEEQTDISSVEQPEWYTAYWEAAPLSPARRTPIRVLWHPRLEELRLLNPQDLVVVVDGCLLGDDPQVGAIAGFVKAMAREWPQHRVVVMEGDAEAAAQEAAALAGDLEVCWREGQRYRVAFLPVAPQPLSLQDKNVLITGGTGSIGRTLAAALIAAGATVCLTGTRPDAYEILQELGPKASYLRLDIAATTPALVQPDLIVHAAGVLADGPIGQVDGQNVWAIKVAGLQHLSEVFPNTPLIALGSYAGCFGNAYQSEYAAANEAMRYLAQRLDRPERRVLVQIWGPWAGTEMVSRIPLAGRQAMREAGVHFVAPEQGVLAFMSALETGGALIAGLRLDQDHERREWLLPQLPWLRDHALMGHPTVPMAWVIERLTTGGRRVSDLTLYEGIVVDNPLLLRWLWSGNNVRIYANQQLAWTAIVSDGGPLQGAAMVPIGEACPLSVDTFYARHTFHGPLLRGVVAVEDMGPQHIRGLIRTGQAAAWGDTAWELGPLAIDSAFQLGAIWARVRHARAGFPIRLGHWQQQAVAPEQTLRATLLFSSATADRFVGTVVIETLQGQCVALGEAVEAELRADGLDIPEENWNFEKFPGWIDLSQRLEMAAAAGLPSPYFKVLEGVARDTVVVDGQEMLHFSGYNYLGFSGMSSVTARVAAAVAQYGTSVSASRVASGERPIHGELERLIAQALGVEAALAFTAGHATNVTTIGHLFGPKDLILHDALIHDSGFQGMKLSGAVRRPFPHNDMQALAKLLEQLRPHFEKCLILVEGVYSMDGDLCDLPTLVALKKQHKAFLMVDEAHSFGVVGPHGYGVSEHYGVPATEVDIWMGTLSKSLASCGGFIAGSSVLITLLKYTAPGFIFSAGLSPANTMAAICALELMATEPWHVKKLQDNCAYFFKCCKEEGLDTGPSAGESAVVPVVVGNSYHALLLADMLAKQGINVQPILYPAVADDASRLRFFLSALHSEAQLHHTAQRVAETLRHIRENY